MKQNLTKIPLRTKLTVLWVVLQIVGVVCYELVFRLNFDRALGYGVGLTIGGASGMLILWGKISAKLQEMSEAIIQDVPDYKGHSVHFLLPPQPGQTQEMLYEATENLINYRPNETARQPSEDYLERVRQARIEHAHAMQAFDEARKRNQL